jgi:hypothetical protein
MIKQIIIGLGLIAAFSMPASAQTWPYHVSPPMITPAPGYYEWRAPGEHPRWHERREERERHEERWRHEEWCRYHPRECR